MDRFFNSRVIFLSVLLGFIGFVIYGVPGAIIGAVIGVVIILYAKAEFKALTEDD